MGKRLGISEARIFWYQRLPHHCPPDAIIKLLHYELRRPQVAAQLKSLDIFNPAIGSRRRDTRLCPVCFVPFWLHAKCPGCDELLCHERLAVPGVCRCGFALV
jgi:hypothetical protein